MTHDPREALKPCPFCGANVDLATSRRFGNEVFCDNCTARVPRDIWNARALTASPGEQKPCGWQFCCPDGKWIGCDEPPANELRDEPEKFRRVYLSPPPAAGWNEAIEAAMTAIENMRVKGAANLVDARHQGQRGCDYTDTLYDAYQAVKALRREAPAPEVVALADWSDLPKDIYVTSAKRVNAVGYDVQCCSVPMVTSPEVRYVRADMITAPPSRPDAGGGVRVKSLEWHDNRHAQSILGVYSINSWSSGAFSILCPNKGYPDNNSFPTVDEAKAAAQADYERRILSALSTSPAAAESDASVEARCKCGPVCEGLEAGNCRYYDVPYSRKVLRRLIDLTWNHVTESTTVPSFDTADTLIDKALSAVGDEAKESDEAAGTRPVPSVSGNSDREQQRDTTGVTAGETATPSEPTASVEARLRERVHFYRNHSDAPVYSGKHVANILETVFALSSRATYNKPAYPNELCNYSGPCGWKDEARFKHFAPDGGKAPIRPDAPNHLTIKTSAELAIAVGDEAKESEGGPLNWQLSDDAKARIAEIDANRRHAALNAGNIVAGSPTPSDPTADRREIVARIINPEVFAKYDAELAKDRRAENGKRWADVCYGEAIGRAFAKADAILAALDGGAGE